MNLSEVSVEGLVSLIEKWRDSVTGLDNMVYEDARKEFSLSAMTGFGADGGENRRMLDFQEVRGSSFETDTFVVSVKEHIRDKSALGDAAIAKLRQIMY